MENYLERMLEMGKLRNNVVELINGYNSKLKKNLNYTFSDKGIMDIFDDKGLVSRLTFDPIPKVKVERENYPLNNDLFLTLGFYRVN